MQRLLQVLIIVLLVAMDYTVYKGYELAANNSDALAILVSLIGLGIFSLIVTLSKNSTTFK